MVVPQFTTFCDVSIFIDSFREILLYIILFYLYVRILCIHVYRITGIACLYLSEMTNKDVK